MGSGSNWEQSLLNTKSLQVLHRKELSMSTGLKVFLWHVNVFYKQEINAKAGALGIEFCKPWNLPTDTP